MAVGLKVIQSRQQRRLSTVADTTVAVTWDLRKRQMVVITADAVAPTSTFLPRLNLLGVG